MWETNCHEQLDVQQEAEAEAAAKRAGLFRRGNEKGGRRGAGQSVIKAANDPRAAPGDAAAPGDRVGAIIPRHSGPKQAQTPPDARGTLLAGGPPPTPPQIECVSFPKTAKAAPRAENFENGL